MNKSTKISQKHRIHRKGALLILQNDTGNKHSSTTIVAAITGREKKAALPTHVPIKAEGLRKKSTVLLEQIRTIDKKRFIEYIGKLDKDNTSELYIHFTQAR